MSYIEVQAAKEMKKISFKEMEHDVCQNLRCWYYHAGTGETVIVLSENKRWRTIRIFDPIWIANMSKADIERLFLNQLLYRSEDFDMAKIFPDDVSFCYVYDVHAGSDWASKFKDFGFEDPQTN